MIMYAQRGNKLCQVRTDEEVQKYLNLGFDIVDEKGQMITANVPNDPNSLKLAYEKHLAEIKSLKEENEALKKEIESLKSTKTAKTTPKKKADTTSEE